MGRSIGEIMLRLCSLIEQQIDHATRQMPLMPLCQHPDGLPPQGVVFVAQQISDAPTIPTGNQILDAYPE